MIYTRQKFKCAARLYELGRFRSVRRYLSVSHIPKEQSVKEDAAYKLLNDIEDSLKYNKYIKSADIISRIQSLHSLGAIIPATYLNQVVSILADRNDLHRCEYILGISRINLNAENDSKMNSLRRNNDISGPADTRSNPIHNPYDSLVSASIGRFFLSGHADSALKLWIRIAQQGYSTSRSGLETLLCAASMGRAKPPIEFIEKINHIMHANLWNQSPTYYTLILKVLRQCFMSTIDVGKSSSAELDNSFVVLTNLLEQSKNILSSNISLHAAKICCLVSFVDLVRRFEIQGKISRKDDLKRDHLISALVVEFHELVECLNRSLDDQAVDLPPWLPPELNLERAAFVQSPSNRESIPGSVGSGGSRDKGAAATASDKAVKEMHQAVGSLLGFLVNIHNMDFVEDYSSREATAVTANDNLHLAFELLDSYWNALQRSHSGHPIPSGMKADLLRFGGTDLSITSLVACIIRATREDPLNRVGRLSKDELLSRPVVPYSARLQHVRAVIERAKNFLTKNSIDLDAELFYTSCVAALPGNDNDQTLTLTLPHGHLSVPAPPLNPQLEESYKLALSFEKEYLEHVLANGKPERREKLRLETINLLCSFNHWSAVHHARRLIIDSKDKDRLDLGNESWMMLLDASTYCAPFSLHSEILSEIEPLMPLLPDLLKRRRRQGGSDDVAPLLSDTEFTWTSSFSGNRWTPSFASSSQLSLDTMDSIQRIKILLRAHSKLAHGLKCVQFLKDIHSLGGKCNQGIYNSVVYSLCNPKFIEAPSENFNPQYQDKKRSLLMRPTATIQWLLTRMLRDGLLVDDNTMTKLFGIYVAGARLVFTDPSSGGQTASQIIDEAEEFLEVIIEKGFEDHPPLAISELLLTNVVRSCLEGGQLGRAVDTIESMPVRYGIAPTAVSYGVLVSHFSRSQSIQELEDVMSTMVSKSIAPSFSIVDDIANAHMLVDDYPAAVDAIQDIFNQFSVRPSVTTILKLLDHSLEINDSFEANRIVVVIRQLYPEEDQQLPYSKSISTQYDDHKRSVSPWSLRSISLQNRFLQYNVKLT